MQLVDFPPPVVIAQRTPRVVIGLILFGVGIALMVRGDLGLPPWDVLHDGISERTDLAIGTVIILVGVAVAVLMISLREPLGVGTILNTILIGVAVNVTLAVVDETDALAIRVPLMLLGPVVVAVGSGLYIGGALGPGPRDGVMTGLARRGMRIRRARTIIEITVLVFGFALGGSLGIGTVWFALSIGPMVDYSLRAIPDLRAT